MAIIDHARALDSGVATEVAASFREAVGADRVVAGVSLAPLTTFRTGGPADWFLQTSDPAEVLSATGAARRLGLGVTMLGGGSNALVGPGGVRGLVIRMWHGSIERPARGMVRASAGVSLNGLVRWTVSRGLSGLERWAGTPGTVGGALAGNAHFDGTLIGDQVVAVGLIASDGHAMTVPGEQMQFGYDESRLQGGREIGLWAEFAVTEGDVATLREVARGSLRYRKQTQPLAAPSAGCIFRNPDPRVDELPEGIPASAGALVDRAGLKGRSVGGASVSRVHANFIVSDGGARPGEIRELIELCRETVRTRFGVELRDEIVYLGEF